ncbi:thiamine biosynthesis lipoprotein ApbE [Desulfitobacterium metallireducens DSM 15288]|uniref:FAD:protein FMN transferase n=1 Tax=Desulfitobacterium metallireducens DSM 15288 TaxID=871968 RepID=W0E6I1_9FIRM|nr:thiamine biosynthesis lipoprotein ApbE [Desulfitobacterium metallireducens DSM 15288]
MASIVLVIMAAGILTACSSNTNSNSTSKSNDEAYTADGFAMGTVISQKIYGTNGESTANETMEKITDLEALLTFNAPEGDIYKLNENAGKAKVELNSETIKILNKAQRISELSGGAFDVTVGPVVKSWGIGTENERIPTPEEIKDLLTLINYKDLEVDGNLASLKRAGQQVDLGGIAKGYAGDVARDIYKKNGIRSAYINLGGNVVTLGNKPDGSPWTVGIRNPRPKANQTSGQQIVGTVTVTDKAVVTAGDDQRYFEKDGKRYHHIIDARTGYPAQSDLMSVTLITDSSFNADAIDTAAFILGLEKGRELIQKQGGIEAVFITKDKKIYVTEGLKENFEFLDESNEYQYVK